MRRSRPPTLFAAAAVAVLVSGPSVHASPPPADDGAVAVATLAPHEEQIALTFLHMNFVLGLVRTGRMLEARPGRQRLVLGQRFADAAHQGVPAAFRPYFEGWEAIELFERADGRVHLTLRFAEWLKAKPVSVGSIRLHDVVLYLSRDVVVEGVLALHGMSDARVGGQPGYATVKKAPDSVMKGPGQSEDFPDGHPWGRDGRAASAVGVEDVRGFSLQATADGFWQTTFEALPVQRLFVYEDRRDAFDVWITYLEAEEYETSPEAIVAPSSDPAFTAAAAFPRYWEREPRASDGVGFFDMSANSRNAPPGGPPEAR